MLLVTVTIQPRPAKFETISLLAPNFSKPGTLSEFLNLKSYIIDTLRFSKPEINTDYLVVLLMHPMIDDVTNDRSLENFSDLLDY